MEETLALVDGYLSLAQCSQENDQQSVAYCFMALAATTMSYNFGKITAVQFGEIKCRIEAVVDLCDAIYA